MQPLLNYFKADASLSIWSIANEHLVVGIGLSYNMFIVFMCEPYRILGSRAWHQQRWPSTTRSYQQILTDGHVPKAPGHLF